MTDGGEDGDDPDAGSARREGDGADASTEAVEWEVPWPAERRAETEADRTQTLERGQSGRSQPQRERRGDQRSDGDRRQAIQPEHSGTHRTRQHERSSSIAGRSERPIAPGSDASAAEETRVQIDERISDDDWIDLGADRPDGEALAAADLSERELREYVTEPRSLHSLVQVHWGIRVTIGATVVGLISSWIMGAFGVNPQLGAALTGGLIVLGLVWVVLHYRLWVYQIRADAIYLERGVVTHVRSLVPYVRIQHVDTSQSPIERALGLSTLVVYTAGSRGADVSIPGLLPDEARDLQRRVKELAIEAEGDDAL